MCIRDRSAIFDEDKKNVQIQWVFTPPTNIEVLEGKDYQFVVYRGKGDNPLERYKIIKSKEPIYTDKYVEGESIYQYAMVVVFEGGKKTDRSEAVNLTTPEIKKK